jgi:hypothetical protein
MIGMIKTRTSPYHTSGNGQVERFNKTMKRMIKAYLKGEQREWDRNLGCLAGMYRAAVHESTGFTPNFLLLEEKSRRQPHCSEDMSLLCQSHGQTHHFRELVQTMNSFEKDPTHEQTILYPRRHDWRYSS